MSEPPKMQWHAGQGQFFFSPKGCYCVDLEDGTHIEVHPDVYDQRFNEYLARLGVKRTTWNEIMRRAEDEWQEYARLMERFAENPRQWLDVQGNGIFVEPGHEKQKRGENRE